MISIKRIIDLHTCIQGEGQLMGIPHFLIRLTGCNLRCVFRNSICDTPYSSHNPEKGMYDNEDVLKLIEQHPQIRYVFITGGEPTIDPNLGKLVELLHNQGLFVTIETNGTRKVEFEVDLMSVSPKLLNSYPDENTAIGKIHRAMNTFVNIPHTILNHNYQMKFVVSNEQTLEYVEEFIKKFDIPKEKVWLMPEGIARETLEKNRQFICEYCIKKGYNYTDRLHIVIYGEKRIS